MIIKFIITMSLFMFVCFIILGVEAGNNEIINVLREEKTSSNALKSNNIVFSAFKDPYNLKYEETEDKIKFLHGISNVLDKYDFLSKKSKSNLDWWQTGIIYEIYGRSFKDSTGTGTGDIRGIMEKIPYLKYLGVSAIWLTPIYPSPGVDWGYDITNYREIDETMGTMKDFEELVNKLHESGIKIILDVVPNHTSEEHEWFLKSIKRIEPYTDYYIWVDPKYVNGSRQVPNNWLSQMAGNSIWYWNEERQQYYLHQFYKEQPDLNFWNPLVREEIKDMLRFWLDKGVDGFRMDAIQHLYERQDLSDAPIERGYPQSIGYNNAVDESFYEVNDWRTLLDEYKKKDGQTRLMMIETYLSPSLSSKFYGNETNPGAHFPLNLCLAFLHRQSTKYFIEKITETISALPSGAWASWTIDNHDIHPRPASRFGEELLDGIHMMQLLLPGTPIIYMGDELGMTDIYLRHDQIYDKESENFDHVREKNRSPFQWDSSPQAGFSNKTITWLPVNPNYVTKNVEFEKNARRSHLKIFKEILNLRQLEAFRTGDVEFYEISEYVFGFSRSNSFFKTYFILLNLGSETENVNLTKINKVISSKLTVKLSSLYAEQNNGDVVSAKSFTLRPSAALVLESSFCNFYD